MNPSHIARKFATLDLISNGRAGWNVVTSWSEAEARNFNREQHVDYDTRATRARPSSWRSLRGLWDSWEEDAFPLRQTVRSVLRREAKMHILDHKGTFFPCGDR